MCVTQAWPPDGGCTTQRVRAQREGTERFVVEIGLTAARVDAGVRGDAAHQSRCRLLSLALATRRPGPSRAWSLVSCARCVVTGTAVVSIATDRPVQMPCSAAVTQDRGDPRPASVRSTDDRGSRDRTGPHRHAHTSQQTSANRPTRDSAAALSLIWCSLQPKQQASLWDSSRTVPR